MSSVRVQVPPIGTSVGRLLVMLAALAGLFAMHGLSDHGVAGPDETMTAAPMSMTHASPVNVSSAHEADATGDTSSRPPGPDGHHMGLGEMCLAVLALALVAGLLLGLRGRWPLAKCGPRWPVDRAVRRWLVRHRPPDLFALSIQRC